MDLLRLVLAILLPPLGVFLQVGFGGHFWLNILLTLLGYIPGIVHAVWIIARRWRAQFRFTTQPHVPWQRPGGTSCRAMRSSLHIAVTNEGR